MKHKAKDKEHLIAEVARLREHVSKLEQDEIQRMRAGELIRESEGRYVTLEIKDDGCGMDESVRARMFDPFFSTKFLGRGFGLPAVLGIVRRHGGFIKARSEPGSGTTFLVGFPVIKQNSGDAS